MFILHLITYTFHFLLQMGQIYTKEVSSVVRASADFLVAFYIVNNHLYKLAHSKCKVSNSQSQLCVHLKILRFTSDMFKYVFPRKNESRELKENTTATEQRQRR